MSLDTVKYRQSVLQTLLYHGIYRILANSARGDSNSLHIIREIKQKIITEAPCVIWENYITLWQLFGLSVVFGCDSIARENSR